MGRISIPLLVIIMSGLMVPLQGGDASTAISMDTPLGDSTASFIGEAAGDEAGFSVTSAGDVNGDGYDDILIGAVYNDEGGTHAGQTYLFFGGPSGWSMDTDLSTADASFVGESRGSNSGISVAGVGDVNGDGFDDILIGASRNDEVGFNAGQSYLILGKASGWSKDTNLSEADASFVGEEQHDLSGHWVAAAGDVNGDGFDDLLIGAHGSDEGGGYAGQAYLIFGKPSGWSMDTSLADADASFVGEQAGDEAGLPVSGVGDVNCDGYDDIVISAWWNDEGGSLAGQAYLVLGRGTGWAMNTSLADADASFIGEHGNDRCGRGLSGAGDVNGDGFDDLLIGAYMNDENGHEAGQAYLILGRETGWAMDTNLSCADASFLGEHEGDEAGFAVAGAGDVNGDGLDDLLIGALQNDEGRTDAGQTYLFLGRRSGWTNDTRLSEANASFIGEAYDDRSGHALAGAGDVNGDGRDDVLIGAFFNDEGGANAGQVYLLTWGGGPPSWGPLPVLEAVEDVPFTYDFTGNVSGPAGSDLAIRSNSWYVTSVHGLNVTFLFPNGVTSASVPLELTDGFYRTRTSVEFTVRPVNDPPTIDLPVTNLSAWTDWPYTYDLSPYVRDVDNALEDLHLVLDSPHASADGLSFTVLFTDAITPYDLHLLVSDGIDVTPATLRFHIRWSGPPGAPVDLTATAGDGLVDLAWQPPAWKEGASPVARYQVLRGLTPREVSILSDLDPSTLAYRDVEVTNGVTYYYVVMAYDARDNASYSSLVSARPIGLPGAPTHFAVTSTDGAVNLSWGPPGDDGGETVSGYRVLRGPSEDALELLAVAPGTTYEDGDVVNGRTYWYCVQAQTAAGVGPATTVRDATPRGLPTAPNITKATPGPLSVHLAWDAPLQDGGSPVTGYSIYRGTSPSTLGPHDSAPPDHLEFLDQGLDEGVAYWYAVAAVSDLGVGERSQPVACQAGPPIPTIGPPSPPTGLAARARGAAVELAWAPPMDDGGGPLTGYTIRRGLSRDSMEAVGEVGPTALNWTDGDVERGVAYWYTVVPRNDAGEGEAAEAVQVEVPDPRVSEGPWSGAVGALFAMLLVTTVVVLVVWVWRARSGRP